MRTGIGIRATAWLALLLTAAPSMGAFASGPGAGGPGGDPEDSLRAQLIEEITRNFDLPPPPKKYEDDTPGVGESIADKMLHAGGEGFKRNVIETLADFKLGAIRGYQLARDGNGTIVVVGAKNGWKFLKKYGYMAGIHYVDSIRYFPDNALQVAKDFGQAGRNIGAIAKDRADHTADTWKDAKDNIAYDAQEAADIADFINRSAGPAYRREWQGVEQGWKSAGGHIESWSGGLALGTLSQTGKAIRAVGEKTENAADASWEATRETASWFAGQTADGARAIGSSTGAVWQGTKDATSAAWGATTGASGAVFRGTDKLASETAGWLTGNAVAPARQARDEAVRESRRNWRDGWDNGIKGGFHEAGDAYTHGDVLLGTVWAIAGVGTGVFYIVLLEPVVMPFIASYGVAGSVALSTLGFPSVGAAWGLGMAVSGATFATGTAATAAIATGGTGLTAIAGGLETARTVGFATAGVGATAAVAAGGAAYTAGTAGFEAARAVTTPVVGLGLIGGAVAAGMAEGGVVTAWNGLEMAGTTGLAAAGYGFIAAYDGTRIAYEAAYASGVAVWDNAIVTPIGVVTNLAQALGTGAWTLAEDPAKGTYRLMEAGGIALGTIATSTGAFSFEMLGATFGGLIDGIQATAYAGVWTIGAAVKGVNFAYAMFNYREHHRWAEFRKQEVTDVLTAIKTAVPAPLAQRYGDLILIRTHWWGSDKGHVRFFVTKDPQTGERWYFKRSVDDKTCEVSYDVTNRDPLVRAFSRSAWSAHYPTGLYSKECDARNGGGAGNSNGNGSSSSGSPMP